jgi:hypothetical protein
MKEYVKAFVMALSIVVGVLAVIKTCKAETIASMPNQGGGKIVLTDERCTVGGKNYPSLNRAYNYTSAGYTMDGCYTVEDVTVVVVWELANGDGQKMRYPASNFTLIKKSKGYGT